MKSYQQFFAELKRRKVFRVMAAYGVIGFGIIEAAEAIFPRVALPDWTVTLVVWLTLLGFPIAVLLAWAFESTPGGVKRTEDATSAELDEIIAQPAARRWSAGILALAGVALLFGGWWLGQRGGADAGLSLAPAGVQAADITKIAVVPFQDMGGNEDNDPLLLNFHVAVIDKLANLGDLRVTQPASVDGFANSAMDARQIAAELADVDYLLMGSVAQVGSQASISIRLVDVVNNDHETLEDWTGEVTVENLFAIQSQIARQVAEELEARLSPQEIERLEASLSTTNAEAINAYYRARGFARLPYQHGIRDMVANAEQAVELAPEFVEAWSLLARSRSLLAFDRSLPPDSALYAVLRTEALAPNSVHALAARGWYDRTFERDYSAALDNFRAAAKLAPSDANVLSGIINTAPRLGEFAEATAAAKRAVELDPLNPDAFADLGLLLGNMSMWDAADRALERAIAIDPSGEKAKWWKLWLIFQRDRDPRGAINLAAEFGLDPQTYAETLTSLAIWDRDFEGAAAYLGNARPDQDDLNGWRLWRFSAGERLETLRGGDPQPYRDSLAAFFEGEPALVEGFKRGAAFARLVNGDDDAGWRLLEEAVAEARTAEAENLDPLWRAALIYARFGRPEEALDLLDVVVAKPAAGGWWSLADLELDPMLDPLRDDPRFEELMARQAAYEEEQARLAEQQGPWLP